MALGLRTNEEGGREEVDMEGRRTNNKPCVRVRCVALRPCACVSLRAQCAGCGWHATGTASSPSLIHLHTSLVLSLFLPSIFSSHHVSD